MPGVDVSGHIKFQNIRKKEIVSRQSIKLWAEIKGTFHPATGEILFIVAVSSTLYVGLYGEKAVTIVWSRRGGEHSSITIMRFV